LVACDYTIVRPSGDSNTTYKVMGSLWRTNPPQAIVEVERKLTSNALEVNVIWILMRIL